MHTFRRTAAVAGLLYLLTHVTSIGGRLLLSPILHSPVLTDPDVHRQVVFGSLIELVLALAVIGTSVALYPIVRRQSPGLAAAYIALRILEASTIVTGALVVLAAVTLQRQASLDPATTAGLSQALITLHNWTFLIGPGLICPMNTAVLAIAVYRSRLVPRITPTLGLIGAPLVMAANLTVMFSAMPTSSTPSAAMAIVPLLLWMWEISLALYLIIKGVRVSDQRVPTPTLAVASA